VYYEGTIEEQQKKPSRKSKFRKTWVFNPIMFFQKVIKHFCCVTWFHFGSCENWTNSNWIIIFLLILLKSLTYWFSLLFV